jgi:hypothetical protein
VGDARRAARGIDGVLAKSLALPKNSANRLEIAELFA